MTPHSAPSTAHTRSDTPSEPEPAASHRQLRLVLALILAITLLSPLLFDALGRG